MNDESFRPIVWARPLADETKPQRVFLKDSAGPGEPRPRAPMRFIRPDEAAKLTGGRQTGTLAAHLVEAPQWAAGLVNTSRSRRTSISGHSLLA